MTAILSSPSYYLPPLIGVAVVLVLIVIALVWSRRDFTVGLFSGFLVSIALHNLLIFGMRSSPDVYHALLWERAMCVPALATFILYYHFTLVYTSNRGQRRVLLASYLLLIVAGALAPTDLVIQGMRVEEYGYAPIVGPISYPWFAVGPLLVLGGAYNLLRYYKVSTMSEERKRAIILAVAVVFPLTGLVLDGFTNLPPVFIWGNLMFSILCTVAVLKYHLLDIRVAVRKSLVYLLVSVGVAIPYVGILLLVNQALQTTPGPWWMHVLIILLLAILLRPLYSWAQNLVDKVFYRDSYDYLKELERFSQETQSVVNLKELGSHIVRLVSGALRTPTVCLLLTSEDNNGFRIVSSVGLDRPPSGIVLRNEALLVKWLRLHGHIVSSEEVDIAPQLQSSSRREKNHLERMGAKLYVPIKTSQGRLSAVLVLGQKLSQQSYADEDKQLLTAVSNHMAMALENAQLYEEARQSEKAVRESEEKLRLTFESITEGITVTDLNVNIVQMNEAAVCMHGSDDKEELIGRSLFEVIAEKDRTRAMANLRRTLENEDVKDVEYTFLRKNGDEFPAELSAATLKDTAGEPVGFVVVSQDITERKEAEQREKQLQEEVNLSSRLASIGELAAGIAHEINNPLTGIVGFSERLLRRSVNDETREELQVIHDEAKRAATVVQNLRTFARRREQKKEYSNINDIVQRTLELRAYELKTSNIEVVTDLAPGLPEISVDSQQIQQVFLNIIVNAEQAMSEANRGGKLHIKTEKTRGHVRASITDDGPGVPAEQLNKIFDPFFTSRGERGGTGLGLSVCHGIVAEHRGRIYVKSKPEKGATFFVELPLNIEQRDDNKVVEAKSTGRSE